MIKKHHSKNLNDRYAPAWKTLEFMPFGSILMIYKNLKNEALQKRICNHYNVRNHHYFMNHMRNLISVRNYCAHGGQLFDLHLAKANADIYGLVFESGEKNNLFGVYKLIRFYLSKISEKREEEFTKKVNDLFKAHQTDYELMNIIQTKSGFLSLQQL